MPLDCVLPLLLWHRHSCLCGLGFPTTVERMRAFACAFSPIRVLWTAGALACVVGLRGADMPSPACCLCFCGTGTPACVLLGFPTTVERMRAFACAFSPIRILWTAGALACVVGLRGVDMPLDCVLPLLLWHRHSCLCAFGFSDDRGTHARLRLRLFTYTDTVDRRRPRLRGRITWRRHAARLRAAFAFVAQALLPVCFWVFRRTWNAGAPSPAWLGFNQEPKAKSQKLKAKSQELTVLILLIAASSRPASAHTTDPLT